MCGKSRMNTSEVSITSEEEGDQRPGKVLKEEDDTDDGEGTKAVASNKRKESIKDKLKRRKDERNKRKFFRLQSKGLLTPTQSTPKKVLTQFSKVWEGEHGFVNQLMGCLPEVRQPGILLEDEERTEEYITQGKHPERGEEKERERALARVRKNYLESHGVETITERATSYQELRERLQRRLLAAAQKPNEVKREKKLKKKQRKKEERAKDNKGKKLISQTASAAGSADNSTAVKEESEEKKTPLKKKPVVKSNGEIVYSKFDFISNDNAKMNGTGSVDFRTSKGKKGNAKPTPEELLKKAEKHEKKISTLAAKGKKSEAVDLAETQKWDTALKRAEGQKVRDDPHLLKKTVKKMDKQKQVTKKKWKERVERVEKLKEVRQQKRQSNIEAKRDDRKKKTKKLMRKRGRIA